MGLNKFKSQEVFLDTAPLIYFIEGNTVYQDKLLKLFTAYDKGDFSFISSTLTLLEVLVQPMKMNRLDLVEQYKRVLSEASGIILVEVTTAVAVKAAELRAKYGLKTPDAIQVATAVTHGAKYFLTNDLRLKTVKEIITVTPNEL
ncbi:type II toxin-antitoxin system VapC family toxin [Pontibacter sp. 172403-2]|uniref:type II toxin-antitoxin system VapC family toxin n=1 Tax=Pontibacter rufus TaxID=2791028 RepID=UPI0018AFF8FF|nr:type II toxin-antitoxin system VapC family toxin [Pontibacter sp. 172403-2]MBF9254314.1 type II toxin-antitoxin system VapC family toxin [Pontibacter sp. 172403-2]